MQAASVERAFGKRKTGKLDEDSAEHGSQAVLVLEARQIAFDNIEGVGEAVRGLPPATRNAVDVVVLVETAGNSCWYATLLKRGDWTACAISNIRPRVSRFQKYFSVDRTAAAKSMSRSSTTRSPMGSAR